MQELQTAIKECSTLWSREFEQFAIKILSDTRTGIKRSRQEYHLRSKYALSTLMGETKVITKNGRFMATKESVISIIQDFHESVGHRGESKTHKKIIELYGNIPRRIVSDTIKICEKCSDKMRRKQTGKISPGKPLTIGDLNQRGQISLVDFQTLPDGQYKHILHYQDDLTKFNLLRALISKTAKEVAKNLLGIFSEYGAPHVLHSDSGRLFVGEIIKQLAELWPGLVLLNGVHIISQDKDPIEKSVSMLKDSLTAWLMGSNTSDWALGLKFVQWNMNTTYNETIQMKPYEAMFGMKPNMGLVTILPQEYLSVVHTGFYEEDFMSLLREAESASASHKENTTVDIKVENMHDEIEVITSGEDSLSDDNDTTKSNVCNSGETNTNNATNYESDSS